MAYKCWKCQRTEGIGAGEELTVYCDDKSKHRHTAGLDGKIAGWLGTARGGTWDMRKYSTSNREPTGNVMELGDLIEAANGE